MLCMVHALCLLVMLTCSSCWFAAALALRHKHTAHCLREKVLLVPARFVPYFGTLLCASAFGMLQDFKVEFVLQRPSQMTVCGEFAAASSLEVPC